MNDNRATGDDYGEADRPKYVCRINPTTPGTAAYAFLLVVDLPDKGDLCAFQTVFFLGINRLIRTRHAGLTMQLRANRIRVESTRRINWGAFTQDIAELYHRLSNTAVTVIIADTLVSDDLPHVPYENERDNARLGVTVAGA